MPPTKQHLGEMRYTYASLRVWPFLGFSTDNNFNMYAYDLTEFRENITQPKNKIPPL